MTFMGYGRGQVIKWDVERGFGFLRVLSLGEDKTGPKDEIKHNMDDAFAHYSELRMEGFKKLLSGQVVEFEAYRTQRGITAKEIDIISEAFEEDGSVNGNVK